MRTKPGRGKVVPGATSWQTAGEVARIRLSGRLRAYADANGLNADDLGRKVNIGVARAQTLLNGSPPGDDEVAAIVRLVGDG